MYNPHSFLANPWFGFRNTTTEFLIFFLSLSQPFIPLKYVS